MMDFTPHLPGRQDKHEKKPEGSKRSRNFSMLIALIITATVAVGSTATAVVFFMKYNNLKKDPTLSAQDNKRHILEKVSKLYDVPEEEPTLARVSDVETLRKDQEFFSNAQNGDYVLVYPKAKLGILYRESTDKIINIGPVATTTENATPPGTSTKTSPSADETQDQ